MHTHLSVPTFMAILCIRTYKDVGADKARTDLSVPTCIWPYLCIRIHMYKHTHLSVPTFMAILMYSSKVCAVSS